MCGTPHFLPWKEVGTKCDGSDGHYYDKLHGFHCSADSGNAVRKSVFMTKCTVLLQWRITTKYNAYSKMF